MQTLNLHFVSGASQPLITSAGVGHMLVRGTAVPSDGATGYAKGCFFIDTDASTGAILWINDGTVASADFNLAISNESIDFLDGVTAGTAAASKALVLDSSGGIATITTATVTTLTYDSSVATVEAAEHGAGAIGTSSFGAPKTYRWIDKGVIITQIKIDLTGLASVATANDVIGLSAGGAAYIGRNVVATNGIIFKATLSCIETPAGGDNDVNVVTNASAVLAYDGAGGTAYISNSGDLLAGQTIENLLPALTANDYFYLTAGTGDTAAAYTAGMYILTLYGHAVL